jgi:hypothetical protein
MARSPVPSKKMDSTTSEMIRTHPLSKNKAQGTHLPGREAAAQARRTFLCPCRHTWPVRDTHRIRPKSGAPSDQRYIMPQITPLHFVCRRARAAAPHGSPSPPCAEADEIGTRRSVLRSGERYIGGTAFYGTAVGRNIYESPPHRRRSRINPPTPTRPEQQSTGKASDFSSYPCSSPVVPARSEQSTAEHPFVLRN